MLNLQEQVTALQRAMEVQTQEIQSLTRITRMQREELELSARRSTTAKLKLDLKPKLPTFEGRIGEDNVRKFRHNIRKLRVHVERSVLVSFGKRNKSGQRM